MIDFFEDNMLEEVDSQGVLDLKDPVEFFFHQIDKNKEKANSTNKKDGQLQNPAESEDLGIIDLDE